MNKTKSIGIDKIIKENIALYPIWVYQKEISFKALSGVYIEHFPFHNKPMR